MRRPRPGPVTPEFAGRGRWLAGACAALARRPDLWPTAARQAAALSRRRWWARPPFLPVVARPWLEFRMETAFGDRHARPSGGDVITWLEWCRSSRRGSGLR